MAQVRDGMTRWKVAMRMRISSLYLTLLALRFRM